MPTYDYACGHCGKELELFQSITASPKRKCPACGKNKLQRRIGRGGGILFRGSGFYQTDYRSASYEAGAKGESPSKPAGEGAAAKEKSPAPAAEAPPEPPDPTKKKKAS